MKTGLSQSAGNPASDQEPVLLDVEIANHDTAGATELDVEGIFVSPSHENVVPKTRFESVLPSPSSYPVVAPATLQEVISPPAEDQVVAGRSREYIVPSRAHDAIAIEGLLGRSLEKLSAFPLGPALIVARASQGPRQRNDRDQEQKTKNQPHGEIPPQQHVPLNCNVSTGSKSPPKPGET